MLGTLSEKEKTDFISMEYAYNCTQHPSTTYSPYILMFGRQPRLPIDFELGLPIDVLGDNCCKTRYVYKLKQILNFAYMKAKEMSQNRLRNINYPMIEKVKGA